MQRLGDGSTSGHLACNPQAGPGQASNNLQSLSVLKRFMLRWHQLASERCNAQGWYKNKSSVTP